MLHVYEDSLGKLDRAHEVTSPLGQLIPSEKYAHLEARNTGKARQDGESVNAAGEQVSVRTQLIVHEQWI